MKAFICLFGSLIMFLPGIVAQDVVKLFQSKEPIDIRATGSIKAVKKNTNDSTLAVGKFEYRKEGENWVNIPMKVKVRGNFRLANCYFPPIKLKFAKKDVDSTLFEGNKALKLVVPCQTNSEKNTLIRKEYLCYQLCELLIPYHFKTRLANFKLTEISGKKQRNYDLLTIFVEDNSLVAKRANGKIVDTKGIPPGRFDEKEAIRNDFFQFMIGNSDWSSVYQHNTNVLYSQGTYFTLAYDFDVSGFVDASYARLNPPDLGTGDIKERVYRGFCRSKPDMDEIRKEFLDKEKAVHAVIDTEAANFSKRDLEDMHSYINEFFEILKSDFQYRTSIQDACRTN